MTRAADQGSAYALPAPSYDAELVLTGKGTPSGEFLRRYWHPVELSSRVKDVPLRVRALGEDMILFRKPDGELGLVYPRCAHRGADLFFGLVDEGGLRCPYHGWQFDPKGRCLDQPCEVDGGGRARNAIVQPWYPVEERYGLVFAYLGPLSKKPPLPKFIGLEDLPDEYEILVDDSTAPAAGPPFFPCNWLQTHENALDAAHVLWLHRDQFEATLFDTGIGEIEVDEHSVAGRFPSELPDGSTRYFVTHLILPNIRLVPHPTLLKPGQISKVDWTLPVDDTTTKVFSAQVWKKGEITPYAEGQILPPLRIYGGKNWFELSDEEHQRMPGDYETQTGQGPITFHSEEHLVRTDKGIVLFRRLLKSAIQTVKDGGDPPLTQGPDVTIKGKAGIFVEQASQLRNRA